MDELTKDTLTQYGAADSLMQELKASAFELLLTNPGTGHAMWRQLLMSDYGIEVVDALGSDPAAASAGIDELWHSKYHDPASGLDYDFEGWSLAFATGQSVEVYYKLVEARKRLREIG